MRAWARDDDISGSPQDGEPQEHRERQDRAGEGAAARGLEALVAISRGGHDRVADALWLAGPATSQPFVPDLERHWRAAGTSRLCFARTVVVGI